VKTASTFPFGTPDGAQADISEVNDRFDDLHDLGGHESLTTAHDDLSARVLVGRMGAGKTIYQRRLQQRAREEGLFTLADTIQGQLPSTAAVMLVARWFSYDAHSLRELWKTLWRRAIMRSAVSQVLCTELRREADPDALAVLETGFADLIGKPRAPRSPQAELGNMLLPQRGHNSVRDYAYDEGWGDLEHYLAMAIRNAPTMRLHIDGVDDHFETSPASWMPVQCGLVLSILDLRREASFTSKLHVVACVRDIVYAELLESEHAPRFDNASYIRRLEWDTTAIRHLLHHKIRKLPAAQTMSSRARDAGGWLGLRTVQSDPEDEPEDIERYLIRHTRMIPRDVVDLGNHLCGAVADAKSDGLTAVPASTVKDVVADRAASFAQAQIRACVNRLATDVNFDLANAGADAFTGDSDYAQGLRRTLVDMIASFGAERFDGRRLQRAAELADAELGPQMPAFEGSVGGHVLNLLWQHRLLGSAEPSDDGERLRYYAGQVGDARLRRDRKRYALHPCVRYAVSLNGGRFDR
jgi:hypothetical protein